MKISWGVYLFFVITFLISILDERWEHSGSVLDKIFERIMFDQLSDHFSNISNTYLAAFRKGFGCQTTLLRLLADWKRELDYHRYVGAILMDLSKAFDCLPHGLIIDKLAAYGLSDSACSLLQSYLSDRKQMVKLGHCKSTFLKIIKGVPQARDPFWVHYF